MPAHKRPVDAFIFSILDGGRPSWPGATDDSFADELEQTLHLHGLHPLIYHLCKDTDAWLTWPEDIRERSRKTALQHAAHSLTVETKTRELLTRLQASGVRPIVLKGTAIAYTHYCEKSARTRGDIDLLFRRQDLPGVFDILEKEGYRYVYRQGYLGQELGFVDASPKPENLPLDIHWRSSSYVLLAHILDHDEILRSAVTIPELAPHPCAMSPVHALQHACLHWAKHAASGDSIRILWAYDIHLLAKGLGIDDIQHFVDSAAGKKISRICQASLASVHKHLPGENLELLLENLNRIQQREPSARLLKSSAASFVLRDIFSAGDGAALVRGLQDIFIPPGAYVLKFYNRRNPLWLPLLYTHRLTAGSLEYLKRKIG